MVSNCGPYHTSFVISTVRTPTRAVSGRAGLVLVVLVGMAIGVYGGLVRLGVPLPAADHLVESHGPLMICGVFGTLIALERAVAIGGRLAYVAPLLLALGGIALIASLPEPASRGLFLAGSSAFVIATGWITLRQRAIFTAVLFAGALALLAGTAWWSVTGDVRSAVGAWLLFLIGTIAAERLELSRAMVRSRRSLFGFLLAVGLLGAGAVLSIDDPAGARLFGLGLLALTAWLVLNDVATATVRMAGQTRFMASAMLAGYVWLPIAGLTLVVAPDAPYAYDLVLHAVLIGFVLSMVFGHALVILPAVARVRLPYSPLLYLPLGVLHLSVLLRSVGGALEWDAVRIASGPVTLIALLGFAGTLMATRNRPLTRAIIAID